MASPGSLDSDIHNAGPLLPVTQDGRAKPEALARRDTQQWQGSVQRQALPGRLCPDLARDGSRPAPPHPPCAHLGGQGWELQVSTSSGCRASALHWARGNVLRRPPWASTQRTARSRRPPPQEALQGPKSPAAQLRRKGTEHWAPGLVPWLAWGNRVESRQIDHGSLIF